MATYAHIIAELLKKGNAADIKASGVSMLPMLWPKMMLHIEPCNTTNLKRGDIAVYYQPSNKLIAHRIVANNGASFLFQGDSCLQLDAIVQASQVVGRVTSFRVGRFAFSLIGTYGAICARCVFGLSPFSHWLNHALAWVVTKILIIRGKLLRRYEDEPK